MGNDTQDLHERIDILEGRCEVLMVIARAFVAATGRTLDLKLPLLEKIDAVERERKVASPDRVLALDQKLRDLRDLLDFIPPPPSNSGRAS